MENEKYAVISLSGGMDSTGLLLNLLANGYKKVFALSFDYGQKHKVELKRVKKNIRYLAKRGFDISHKVINLKPVMGLFESALTSDSIDVPEGNYAEDNMKATVVPNRNAIFSSLVYGYALSVAVRENVNVDIALGVHSGDHAIYPDCRPEFYDAIKHAFDIGNWDSDKVEFYLPYLNGDKCTILVDAQTACKQLKLRFNTVFRNTNTCYQPNENGESCGKCGSCTERIEAFDKLKTKDPVSYSSDYDQLVETMRTVLEKE